MFSTRTFSHCFFTLLVASFLSSAACFTPPPPTNFIPGTYELEAIGETGAITVSGEINQLPYSGIWTSTSDNNCHFDVTVDEYLGGTVEYICGHLQEQFDIVHVKFLAN